MPIDYVHGADPLLQAQAAAMGAYAPVAEELRRYEEQQALRERQYADEQDWRLQAALLQQGMERNRLGQQAAFQSAQLQSQNYNNEMDYALGAQQLDQQAARAEMQAALTAQGQEEQTRRAQMSQLGQIARQQQGQQFQLAMADYKSFNDVANQYTPRQQEQFWQRWEQKYGMSRTAPQEAMMAEDSAAQDAKRQQYVGMLQAPDGSGEMMGPPGLADLMMTLPPEKAADVATKTYDTWTRRKKDEQQAKAQETQWQESVANMQRDDERANQQLEHTQQSHEQQMQMAQEKARAAAEQNRQKILATAATNYQSVMAKRAAAKSAAMGMTVDLGPDPKLEDFLPPGFMDTDSGIASPKTPEELNALPPGTKFRAPDGTIRTR